GLSYLPVIARELEALIISNAIKEKRFHILSNLLPFLFSGAQIGGEGFLDLRCAAWAITESGLGWPVRQAGESSGALYFLSRRGRTGVTVAGFFITLMPSF
ncbi:hypothetical protein NDU88_001334, partial [Pleurodeles waltl]